MKTTLFGFLITVAVLFSLNSRAQSTSMQAPVMESTTLEQSETRVPVEKGLSVFLTSYPIPILSYGAGLSVEYNVISNLALTAGVSQFGKSDNNAAFGFEAEKKNVNNLAFLGLKYFPRTFSFGKPFLATGYQSGRATSNIRPGLFAGPEATVTVPYQGAFASLGFTLEGQRSSSLVWVVDLAISYAPGEVKDSSYVADSTSQTGIMNMVTAAHVESTLGYGFFPTAQIGVRF